MLKDAVCLLYPGLRRADVEIHADTPAQPMTDELRGQTDEQLNAMWGKISFAPNTVDKTGGGKKFALKNKLRLLAVAIIAAGLLVHLPRRLIAKLANAISLSATLAMRLFQLALSRA